MCPEVRSIDRNANHVHNGKEKTVHAAELTRARQAGGEKDMQFKGWTVPHEQSQ